MSSTAGAAAAGDVRPVSISWQVSETAQPDAAVTGALQHLINRKNRLIAAGHPGDQPDTTFSINIKGVEIKAPPPILPSFKDFEIWDLGLLDSIKITNEENFVNWINNQQSGFRAALSANLTLAAADSWCPREASFAHLGTTGLARAQLRANAADCAHATGENVFVIIVDQGINLRALQQRFPRSDFGGGWKVNGPGGGLPGTWPDGHGTRMAEAVLSIAPRATIIDLPLLPPRIRNVRGFLPWAAWAYWSISWVIPQVLRRFPGWRFVICNSWSIYDLRRDFPDCSPWNQGANPDSVINRLVAGIARRGLADIVFAAGNAGQFCPDRRAAPDQIGPGRSIHGLAALPEVLTVGAVRNDQTWLGYSGQGPSPCSFHSVKPDLVAPSQFTWPADAARGYGGTSAACALAAGAMAAARSLATNATVSPAEMIARAVHTARPLAGRARPASRIGRGMLDMPGLLGI